MVTTDHYENKTKKLRKGKVDIILMTVFFACFFEYSQLKMIDLLAAKFRGGFCFPVIILLSNCQATQ